MGWRRDSLIAFEACKLSSPSALRHKELAGHHRQGPAKGLEKSISLRVQFRHTCIRSTEIYTYQILRSAGKYRKMAMW